MLAKIILAADGDDDCRTAYSTFLQCGGFVVLEARSTAEALELVETESPAAVITVLRPAAASLELLERLRGGPSGTRIPVLVVSDDDDSEHRARAAAAGCATFLAKPCPPHELLHVLCDVTDRQASASPA